MELGAGLHGGLLCHGRRALPHFEQLVLELDQKADLEQVEDVHQQAVQVGQSEDIVARQLARKNAAPQKDRTDRATAHQARVDDECSLDLVGVRVAVQVGLTNRARHPGRIRNGYAMGRDQVGGRRGSADQSIRHHNLGHGHVQARDKHHDKLVYDALWRLLLETAVHLDEGERWDGRTHSCEPRHPLVEQVWKPALPSKAVTYT